MSGALKFRARRLGRPALAIGPVVDDGLETRFSNGFEIAGRDLRKCCKILSMPCICKCHAYLLIIVTITTSPLGATVAFGRLHTTDVDIVGIDILPALVVSLEVET